MGESKNIENEMYRNSSFRGGCNEFRYKDENKKNYISEAYDINYLIFDDIRHLHLKCRPVGI